MKILIQWLWQDKIHWDHVIPSKLSKNWQDRCKQLSLLSSVTIPRRLSLKENLVQDNQLHGFADVSTQLTVVWCTCILCVVYLRNHCCVEDEGGPSEEVNSAKT